jgi:hypothetical protein
MSPTLTPDFRLGESITGALNWDINYNFIRETRKEDDIMGEMVQTENIL